jgi:hypothetical protein
MHKPHSTEREFTNGQFAIGIFAFIVAPLIFAVSWPF